jgi:hypothetical protein
MPKDACYYKVKRQFRIFPSARASQALAKCRKASGHVRKSASGAALKRWGTERWVNVKTGRPCGNEKDKNEYCRPTKRVSAATPVTRKELAARRQTKAKVREKKRVGMRHRVTSVKRKKGGLN